MTKQIADIMIEELPGLLISAIMPENSKWSDRNLKLKGSLLPINEIKWNFSYLCLTDAYLCFKRIEIWSKYKHFVEQLMKHLLGAETWDTNILQVLKN